MHTHAISSYILRTLDVDAAIAFYDAVLGRHGDTVYELHESARARGARPHWLGAVHTDTLEEHAAALLADGGDRLGPRPGGGPVLRDPGGALLSLGPVATASTAGVVWHVLRTRDADAAAARYARVFGWSLGETITAGPGSGSRTFAWEAGGVQAGAIGGIEGTPEVHPQWLYFFGVASVEKAVATAIAHGARMTPTVTLPDGRVLSFGDDPQGAAFGLMQLPGGGDR